ncbi:MAG TPA: tripartite tricarboxylate transporter substrate binding protein [Casimicrobiaceae bacterium]|nr:tripartite tricarboxylate transporter substrate binding protein [Casimicrobiaceae bacterium]
MDHARRRNTVALAFVGAALALGLAAGAAAQGGTYPARPIRLVVPFPPGAGTDTVARFVAQKLGDAMKATIVIDNKTGAGGAIGAAEAAKADPDGYTLLFVAGPFTTVAAASKNAAYDPVQQFTPVASIAVSPLVFVVNVDVPAKTMREFIALAKREPGKLDYGSAGPGSINHLALELMNARAGTVVVHIPYKGISPATQDLLSGQIQAMTGTVSATLPYIAEKKVRALAVTGARRAPLLPDVPTWQDEGVPDANVINYWGIVAPAGTPAAVVARLNAEVNRVLAQPDVRERLAREGAEIVAGPPERLGTIVRTDLDGWKKLIVDAKLSLE